MRKLAENKSGDDKEKVKEQWKKERNKIDQVQCQRTK